MREAKVRPSEPARVRQHAQALAHLPVRPANAQHKGQRDAQQDAFGFSALTDTAFGQHGGYLAVLADGMGGLQNGVWASTQGVRAFLDAYAAKTPSESIAQSLSRALCTANAVVHAEAERLDLVGDMGSTLVAAVVHEMSLQWINAGDSRVYLFEAGRLMCLSTDHNYGEKLKQDVLKGVMSASEAAEHPARNALTSNLGRPEPLTFDTSPAPLRLSPGAWVLLCSDGLSGVLTEAEIARELHGDPQQACDRLLQAAIGRGLRNQDNTTVVVFHIPKADGLPQQATRRTGARAVAGDPRTRLMRLLPPIGALLCAALLGAAALLWLHDRNTAQDGAAAPAAPHPPTAPGTPVQIVEGTSGTATETPARGGTGSIFQPVLPPAPAPAAAPPAPSATGNGRNSRDSKEAARKHKEENAALAKAATVPAAQVAPPTAPPTAGELPGPGLITAEPGSPEVKAASTKASHSASPAITNPEAAPEEPSKAVIEQPQRGP